MPAGLIFHTSRCGSTLACRMLAALPGITVADEPPELEVALGADVIKLDAWSVLELDAILRRLPGTPWVFLFRDPGEVLASHAAMPGSHMVPGLRDVGVDPDLPVNEFRGAVYERIAEAALAATGGLFLDYRDLPAAVITRIAPHFGLTADADLMNSAARMDAKTPQLPFDPRPRHGDAPAGARAAYARLQERAA